MSSPITGWVESSTARSLTFLAGLITGLWALRLLGSVSTYSWLAPVVLLLTVASLIIVIYSLLPIFNPEYVVGFWGFFILILALIGFCLWSFIQVAAFPAYGTDEIAFDQYAAILAFHGHNPYTASMAPSFDLFRVSPNGYTFLLNGKRVLNLSYPALSFLLYFPTLILGITYQGAVITNIAFWVITTVMLYLMLPKNLKMLAVVINASSMFIAYAVGGVTDPLFMPFLLVAAYKWDQFIYAQGLKKYIGPIFMGLAMSVKQNAWIALVFMVIAVALESIYQGKKELWLKNSLNYALCALAAFVVTNLPFISISPVQWFKGITTPFLTQAVPAGQGLVELTIFSGLGGGFLSFYSLALAFAGILLILLFVKYYQYGRYVLFITPSLILFFSSRSFSSYLVTMLPIVFIGAISIKPLPNLSQHLKVKPLFIIIAVAGLILSSIGAIAYPSPLSLGIVRIVTTGQLETIDVVTVSVHNFTNKTLTPSYSIQVAGADTEFWRPIGPDNSIGPNQTKTVTLISPSFYADPPIGEGFQVVAYTENPAAVSVSPAFVPQNWHVALTPVALRKPQWPVGVPLAVKAQILDKFNRPVRIAGIPIYMGQIIYGQNGVEYSSAIISIPQAGYSGSPGTTPVAGYTNNQGYVIFNVVGTSAGRDPTYFEANLEASAGPNNYPYGYSEILAVRFG